MKKSNLILLTNGFPYEKGEQFLESEILILSKCFEEIYIYPISLNGYRRSLPNNVHVVEFKKGVDFSVKSLLFRNFYNVIKVLFSEFSFSEGRSYYLKHFKKQFNNLMGLINDAENFGDELNNYDLSKTKIYSYWFDYWGDVMCMINAVNPNSKPFITRVHGSDYDADRRPHKFIPFRLFNMKFVNSIIANSSYAKYKINSEFSSEKIVHVSRLGVFDKGTNENNDEKIFHIVSCSAIIKLKRVHLIADIIKLLPFNVKWTHFGNGHLLKDLEKQVIALHIEDKVDFKGFVSNEEVIKFYNNSHVDLFINVSEFEGIPVSIMEAISFGIPSIGCDICGIPEIINEQTGFILKKEFTPNEALDLITKYYDQSYDQKVEIRKGVKLYWEGNFNAQINYPSFINKFLK